MILSFLRRIKLNRCICSNLYINRNCVNGFQHLNEPTTFIRPSVWNPLTFNQYYNFCFFKESYTSYYLGCKTTNFNIKYGFNNNITSSNPGFRLNLVGSISTLKRRKFKIKKHKKKKRKKRWSRMSLIPWRPPTDLKQVYRSPAKVRRIVKERRARNKGNRTLRAPRQR